MERSYRVLLDANIILAPTEIQIDLLGEIHRVLPGKVELITLEPVYRELKRRKRGIGIKILEALKVKVLPATGPADQAILDFANKTPGVVVATNDEDLKRKLRERSVPVIFVRGKQKLELEGYVG